MQPAAHIIARTDRPGLIIRKPVVSPTDSSPRFWFGGSPTATHFMNALSCSFPGGERFFVRSVNAFQDKIEDEQLRRDLRVFSAQEAVHGKSHEAFNRWLDSQGIPATRWGQLLEWYLDFHAPFFPREFCVAYTAAMEHLTAVLGHAILSTKGFSELMHREMRMLWTWHAIEEIEHKSVAFDVQKAAGVGYFTRTTALVVALIGLYIATNAAFLLFLIKDRKLFDLASHRRFYQIFFASGFFKTIFFHILAYFRRDFHPWQLDDRALIQEGLESLAHQAAVEVKTA